MVNNADDIELAALGPSTDRRHDIVAPAARSVGATIQSAGPSVRPPVLLPFIRPSVGAERRWQPFRAGAIAAIASGDADKSRSPTGQFDRRVRSTDRPTPPDIWLTDRPHLTAGRPTDPYD